MANILLMSVTGSPGVTNTTLAMTMTWPNPAMLAEVDTSKTSCILPGYLRGEQPHTRSLINLAVAARGSGTINSDQIWSQTVELAKDRWLLPGLVTPAAAPSLAGLWGSLGTAAGTFERSNIDVLFDAGRWSVSDQRSPLMTLADAVVILAHPTLPDITALRDRLPAIQTLLAEHGHPDHLGLLLVSPSSGPSYSSGDISKNLGVPVLGKLPWDPKTAPVFHTGQPQPGRLDRSPYMKALAAAMDTLKQEVRARRERLSERSSSTKERV